jgi:hypothetical protein
MLGRDITDAHPRDQKRRSIVIVESLGTAKPATSRSCRIALRIDNRGAAHFALVVVRRERRGAVQGAAIVPDHQIADAPFVHIDKALLGGEGEQFVEQRPALVGRLAER